MNTNVDGFNKKRMIKYGTILILIVIATVFIFCNSFADYEKSYNISDLVSETVLPHKYAASETASFIVRQFAYLIEYAALGMAVM